MRLQPVECVVAVLTRFLEGMLVERQHLSVEVGAECTAKSPTAAEVALPN